MDDFDNVSHNVTTHEEDEIDKIPRPIILLIRSNGLLVMLLNSFVLVFILCNRKIFRDYVLWTQMISLCMNDTFAGISIVVVSYIDNPPFFNSRVACRLVLLIALCSQLTTLCNIFAIGVHRIWILKRLHRIGLRPASNKPFVFQICANISIGVAFTLTAVFGWSINDDVIAGCEFTAAYGLYKSKATLFIACSVFIPLLMTNVLYVIAFVILKRSLRLISPVPEPYTVSSSITPSDQQISPTPLSNKKKLSRERNAFLIIGIVLIAIDIFTIPTLVMQVNTAFSPQDSQLPRTVKLSIASTITFNSFINPFIYIIRMPEFRKKMGEYMRRLLHN